MLFQQLSDKPADRYKYVWACECGNKIFTMRSEASIGLASNMFYTCTACNKVHHETIDDPNYDG